MFKLTLLAEAYGGVKFAEVLNGVNNGNRADCKHSGIGKVIEWPTIPRVNEQIGLHNSGEIFGRVIEIFHIPSDDSGRGEIRLFCYVTDCDYINLQEAGWQEI